LPKGGEIIPLWKREDEGGFLGFEGNKTLKVN
jgi:hypothetical protein